MICLWVDLFGFILFGTPCASYTWLCVSFFRFGKIPGIVSSNTFLSPPFSFFFFWDSFMCRLAHIVWHTFFFHLSFFYCSDWVGFVILFSRPLTHSSALFILPFLVFSLVFILAIWSSNFIGFCLWFLVLVQHFCWKSFNSVSNLYNSFLNLMSGRLKRTVSFFILSGVFPFSFNWEFSSVQSLSRVQLFVTPRITAHQTFLSITNSQSLLKLMPIESVMPSSHLILYCPLLLPPPIPPSIRVFSNESTLCMRWPKYWSFSISPSNEHPGLISFRMDWLDLLAIQGTV